MTGSRLSPGFPAAARSRSASRARAARRPRRRAPSRRRACGRPRRAATPPRRTVRPAPGRAIDPRRHPAEHDLAPARRPHRVGARAVDRGPDDLRDDLARGPRRGEQRLATRHGAGVDLEAVLLLADAADEALAELRAPPGLRRTGGLGRLLEGRRRGRQTSTAGTRLRDERVTVEEEDEHAVARHRERPLERRRQPERHLDRVGDRRTPRGNPQAYPPFADVGARGSAGRS